MHDILLYKYTKEENIWEEYISKLRCVLWQGNPKIYTLKIKIKKKKPSSNTLFYILQVILMK